MFHVLIEKIIRSIRWTVKLPENVEYFLFAPIILEATLTVRENYGFQCEKMILS